MLGDVTKKYESGRLGPNAISNDSSDPGGASYGTYQLSANTGTLKDFLSRMDYTADFQGLTPGTLAFNMRWHDCCKDPDFCKAQWQYIYDTHYAPVRAYADTVSVLNTNAIDEAIWSISVQHGRADHIIYMATQLDSWDNNEVSQINALYDARCTYVKELGMAYLIKNRYIYERQDVLNMVKEE